MRRCQLVLAWKPLVFEYSNRDFFLSLKSRFCWLFEGLGFSGIFSCELLEIVLVDGGTSMRLFEDDFVLSISVYFEHSVLLVSIRLSGVARINGYWGV
jgi:hypothetical protein